MYGKPKGRFYFGTSCPDISRLKTVPSILCLVFSSPGQSWAWVIVSSGLSSTGCNSRPPLFRPSSYTSWITLNTWQDFWYYGLSKWFFKGQLSRSRRKLFSGSHKSLAAERGIHTQGSFPMKSQRYSWRICRGKIVLNQQLSSIFILQLPIMFPLQNFRFFSFR